MGHSQTPRNSRETKDYEEGDYAAPNFVDHFSLREPSSTVKFRGTRVHVYDTDTEQILLEDRRSSSDTSGDEEDDNNGKDRPVKRHRITVKRMPLSSFGLRVLRLAYTLIALLIFGYAFALSFQIILFLFVNLAVDIEENAAADDAGMSNANSIISIVSTLLSVPIFLYGFSSLMAIATTFVSEAWSGGHLIRAVGGAPPIVSELMYFVFFIFIPAITLLGSFFARIQNPWEVACYAWLGSVALVFCCFGLAIVYCEVSTCFTLISIHYGEETEDGHDISPFKKFFLHLRRAILIVQSLKYSGKQKHQYLVTGDDVAPKYGYTYSDTIEPTVVNKSLYTRFTELGCLQWMYKPLDPPKRTYTIEEVRDVLPFVTTHSWSLENMFCTNTRSRKIISAKGPSALTNSQVLSSSVCNIVGTFIIIVTAISFLYWISTGLVSYIIVGIMCFICCLVPLFRANKAVVQLYLDINKRDYYDLLFQEEGSGDDDNDAEVQQTDGKKLKDNTTVFQLWETSRVTQPKAWVCYTGMILELELLFVFPMVTLFAYGNYPIGITFTVVALISFVRKYFDAAAILCGLGSLDTYDIETDPGERKKLPFNMRSKHSGSDKTLVEKSRVADVVGYISRSDSVYRWMCFFSGLVLGIFFLCTSASATDDGLGERKPIILVDDYFYPAEDSLQYPTCSMRKGFDVTVDGVTRDTSLGDYAFLSALAYETTNVTGYILPEWFGEGVAVDESELVAEYRKEVGTDQTPVYFKFFTFPSDPDLGVLSIRGSQTLWDWMVNMQLWSAAGLAQIVKWVTPYGWIWTPILDDLVWFIGFIQSSDLDNVSYYKVTTGFANKFKESYSRMRVTGASLGGGLAIITGAQARTPAVAISGLGAELSRNTLKPRISLDDINKYVFNFIPDRDYIARVGGRPRQHQEAQCSASSASLFGCHSMWRSVCEINYRCGSGGRPVICRCHYQFDYPEPEPIGTPTRTFKEACEEEEEAFLKGTGSTVTSGFFSTPTPSNGS